MALSEANASPELLMAAARRDGSAVELARSLMGRGARCDVAGAGGLTALHVAAGNTAVGAALIALFVAQTNRLSVIADDGTTPLAVAFSADNFDAVRILCKAGASIDMMDAVLQMNLVKHMGPDWHAHYTQVFYAALRRDIELISEGAPPVSGWSAHDLRAFACYPHAYGDLTGRELIAAPPEGRAALIERRLRLTQAEGLSVAIRIEPLIARTSCTIL